MRRTERDAEIKLLILQGALYRVEIVEAKSALRASLKPSATPRRLFSLLSFALEHKQLTLIGALLLQLLGRLRSGRSTRRILLMAGFALIGWWLMRRRSEA